MSRTRADLDLLCVSVTPGQHLAFLGASSLFWEDRVDFHACGCLPDGLGICAGL